MTQVPERHSAAERRYFGWIAQLPCVVTHQPGVQVAHLRYADSWFDKPLPGTGRKPLIPYVLPLTPEMHREQEAGGGQWWLDMGFGEFAHTSPLALCWTLYRIYLYAPETESVEVAARIIAGWRLTPMEGAR